MAAEALLTSVRFGSLGLPGSGLNVISKSVPTSNFRAWRIFGGFMIIPESPELEGHGGQATARTFGWIVACSQDIKPENYMRTTHPG